MFKSFQKYFKAFTFSTFHSINRSPYDLGEYENWWRHFFTIVCLERNSCEWAFHVPTVKLFIALHYQIDGAVNWGVNNVDKIDPYGWLFQLSHFSKEKFDDGNEFNEFLYLPIYCCPDHINPIFCFYSTLILFYLVFFCLFSHCWILLSFSVKTENSKNGFGNLKNETKELEKAKERKIINGWDPLWLVHQRPCAKRFLFFPSDLMKSFRRTANSLRKSWIWAHNFFFSFFSPVSSLFFALDLSYYQQQQVTNLKRSSECRKKEKKAPRWKEKKKKQKKSFYFDTNSKILYFSLEKRLDED